MPSPKQRKRFSQNSDWVAFLDELKASEKGITGGDLYQFRAAVYKEIEELRERPLLVYAADFLSGKDRHGAATALDLQDMDGFIDLVGAVPDGADAVDVAIESPGGSPEAVERIVLLLRNRFAKVSFLVPHSAYSAATMLALSGDEVLLHPGATLGPIDPQINGIPARSIRRGFDKVRDLLKDEGPEALPAYLPLIEKHSLEILEICDDSLKLSKELACEWMEQYMFAGAAGKKEIVERAVDYFSDYDTHKTHSRPLTFSKLEKFGLNVIVAEPVLARLMREVHVLITGFFGVTPFVKLFENSDGLSWGRQIATAPTQPAGESPQVGTNPR